MNCHEFEDRLQRLLDERERPEADLKLRAHAEECELCRQTLHVQEALFAGLRAWRAPAMTLSAAATAEAAVGAEVGVVQRKPTSSIRQWLGMVAGLAVVVLLAFGIAWQIQQSGNRQAVVADGSKPKVSREKRIVRRNKPTRSVDKEVGKELATANNQPQHSPTLSPGIRQPLGTYSMTVGNFAARFPEAVDQLGEVERYAPGIRPIRISFSLILDALRRAIPGFGEADDQPDTSYVPRQRAVLI